MGRIAHGFVVTAGIVAGVSLLVSAQPSGRIPRLPGGRPDLQGMYDLAMLTPLERPAGLPAVLTDEQAQAAWKTLNETKGVDLLSAPRLTTRSKQRATIEIIREFRYPTEWAKDKKPVWPIIFCCGRTLSFVTRHQRSIVSSDSAGRNAFVAYASSTKRWSCKTVGTYTAKTPPGRSAWAACGRASQGSGTSSRMRSTCA